MRKRRIVPAALKAIRELKAAHDPRFKANTFAATCHISPSHLCNIEAGRRKHPPEDLIWRLAIHLDVSIDAISVDEIESPATALEAVA